MFLIDWLDTFSQDGRVTIISAAVSTAVSGAISITIALIAARLNKKGSLWLDRRREYNAIAEVLRGALESERKFLPVALRMNDITDENLQKLVFLQMTKIGRFRCRRAVRAYSESKTSVGYNPPAQPSYDYDTIIRFGNVTGFNDRYPQSVARCLTWAGHDFLDAMRDDTIWKKAKEKVLAPTGKEIVGASFAVLLGWLRYEAAQKLGIPPELTSN